MQPSEEHYEEFELFVKGEKQPSTYQHMCRDIESFDAHSAETRASLDTCRGRVRVCMAKYRIVNHHQRRFSVGVLKGHVHWRIIDGGRTRI